MKIGFLVLCGGPILTVVCYASLGVSALSAETPLQWQVGKKLFHGADPACSICHSLKDARAQGEVGPNLDELKPNAKRVATALRNGIGQMPSYKETLTEQEIAALAAYVSKVTGAPK